MASEVPYDAKVVTAREALGADGFAMVDGVFPDAQVDEVESILDRLLAELRSPGGGGRGQFVRDMAPAAPPSGTGAATGRWHQPEIAYPACLRADLLDTALFRTCRAMAAAIGGHVSRSFDHAIYKAAGSAAMTPWHQDRAFAMMGLPAAPSRLHFWIPLQDATVENGCMHFIPGSHAMPLLRHRRFVRRSGAHGLELAELDETQAVACPVRRGGLTIHTPYTLHCAGPNLTDAPRKAWIIQFAPFGTTRLAVKRLLGRTPAALAASPAP